MYANGCSYAWLFALKCFCIIGFFNTFLYASVTCAYGSRRKVILATDSNFVAGGGNVKADLKKIEAMNIFAVLKTAK